jgi:phage tail-like protein
MPARSYVTGNFQLVLEGNKSGFLKSIEGGTAAAEVVAEPIGGSPFVKKHLGPVGYEAFVARFGLSMNKDVYEWINASWSANYQRKNGAVVAIDNKLTAVSQREFFNALVTETTFPKLDGGSKDPAHLTLTFAPEYTRTSKASGKVSAPSRQKLWLPSNFRVTIDGLDCTRVRAVESFTVRQSLATDDIGDARDYLKEPGKLEFPNLAINLAESSAKTWLDWFESFVIKGNSEDRKEKNGSIAILSPNLQDELLRVDLFNLGIFKIAPDKAEANVDRVATVTAHLYCERMELHLGAATDGPQQARRSSKVKGQKSKVRSKAASPKSKVKRAKAR